MIPALDEFLEVKAKCVKHHEDELLYLGTSSTHFQNLEWFGIQIQHRNKELADNFVVLQFFEFTASNYIYSLDQVIELQILKSKLKDLKVEVSESLQARVIIAKLSPSWNDYRKKLLHSSKCFTLGQLHKYFRVEKEFKI